MASNLATIRQAIEMYKVQHNDNFPASTADGGTVLINQLTTTTAIGGGAGTAYGPYLRNSFPKNPVNSLNTVEQVNGYYQAVNIPRNTGTPVQYAGSTTGPSYNEKGSPLQVSWSVRPNVMKVSIKSVAKWLENNEFDESYAHGVRNLVVNPALLSN